MSAGHIANLWLAHESLCTCSHLHTKRNPFFHSFVASFFFHGLHETVHRTSFCSRMANNVCAHIFGFLCLRPARHYWYNHCGSITQEYRKSRIRLGTTTFLDFSVETPFGYTLSTCPVCLFGWMPYFHLLFDDTRKVPVRKFLYQMKRREATMEARVCLAFFITIAMGAVCSFAVRSSMWRFWIFPTVLGQLFLRFYVLAGTVCCARH